jgi:WD40 repeat protein
LRGHEGWVSGALELRDGRLLSWAEDDTLRLWAADGTELKPSCAGMRVRSAARWSCGTGGCSRGWDNTLRLWAADGTEIAVLRGHEGSIEGALELRDGRLLSWSRDWTLRLWAADGTERAVLRGHEWDGQWRAGAAGRAAALVVS